MGHKDFTMLVQVYGKWMGLDEAGLKVSLLADLVKQVGETQTNNGPQLLPAI